MPFETSLSLESGDREVLDSVVEELVSVAERKGVEVKGPHTHPPHTIRVSTFRRPTGTGGEFSPWRYTVFKRTLRILGHEEVARQLAEWDVPESIHVSVTVERIRSAGSS